MSDGGLRVAVLLCGDICDSGCLRLRLRLRLRDVVALCLCACGAVCQALGAWRPGGRDRLRQAGPGLGSPAHVHLKPGLNGRSSAGSVASTASARSPSGRARRRGWRTGDFRPQRSDSPALRAPAHPAAGDTVGWETKRVSAHRGPRQPARQPHASESGLACERVRFALEAWRVHECASGLRIDRAVGKQTRCGRPCQSIRGRFASARLAGEDLVRSVRTAPKLSRPSMGRDTPPLPKANASNGRVGRHHGRLYPVAGLRNRRLHARRAELHALAFTSSSNGDRPWKRLAGLT